MWIIQSRKDFSSVQCWKLWENYLRYQCSKYWISYFQWEEWNSTDYIINVKWKLLKVQIKTTIKWIQNWCLRFWTSKKDKKWKRIHYSKNEVDYFVFFDAFNEKMYMISFEETPKTEISIRINKSKNNQKVWIIYWEDYLFDTVIEKLIKEISS